jgi:ABC-type maltose transport system permease subunit
MEPVQPNTGTRMAGTSQIETHQTAAVAKRNRQFRAVFSQVLLQLFLLFVALIVLFPVMWIVSMAVDPRGVARPTDLTLIPANATLDAFTKLLTQPFSNVLPLYFGDMLMNSLFIALGVSLFTVVLGSSAAYAFSRFRFRGREGGMLVFILLLLLPSTGLVIPLYVLFSSVPVAPGLAEFFPAFFSGVLVAGAAYIAYAVVRSYAQPNPERRFNPTPAVVAGFMVVALLLVSLATWWIMFTRAPLYNDAFLTPIGEIQDEFRATAADVSQREGSVAQRFATVERRERNAVRDEEVAQAIAALENRVASADDAAIGPIVQDEIAARQAQGDASNDAYLAWLLEAQPALESEGAAAFRDNLSGAAAQFQEVAAGTRSGADSARASAEEAAVNLENARAQLAVAQAASDNEAQALITERNNAFLALVPYALLTWVIGLGVGALVWMLTAALHGVIEPQRLIFYLLLFIMSALLVMVTYQTWEWRMALAGTRTQSLRTTLLGLALAFAAGGFPFAIWNLKGYFDTIPKEIEEAARIDGAGRLQTFFVVMIPLSLPAFAIVILFSFMNGWTEFILSWIFLTGQTQNYTLAMALATMTGGANTAPPDMQKFAAMAILISLPILILFFVFQKWMVSGLSLGGVKG